MPKETEEKYTTTHHTVHRGDKLIITVEKRKIGTIEEAEEEIKEWWKKHG